MSRSPPRVISLTPQVRTQVWAFSVMLVRTRTYPELSEVLSLLASLTEEFLSWTPPLKAAEHWMRLMKSTTSLLSRVNSSLLHTEPILWSLLI